MEVTIRQRLRVSAGVGACIAALMGGVGALAMREEHRATERVAATALALRRHLEADMLRASLWADTRAAQWCTTSGQFASVREEVRRHAERLRQLLAEPDALDLPADIQQARGGARPAMEAYVALAEHIVESGGAPLRGTHERAPELEAAFRDLENRMSALGDRIEASHEAHAAVARASQRRAIFATLLASVLGAALWIASSFWTVRGIVRPLARVGDAMRGLASGDLTRRLDVASSDEGGRLASAYNELAETLSHSLGNVLEASQIVSTASSELQRVTIDISDRAQQQASSLEETAASLEQITATVRQNADNAAQANQLAADARHVADRGGRVVTDAVAAMSEINQASRKIADIITTIDEIAFQTNLLALNAAVEAARAGEQGRGFAVVAAEVRHLAQRSATAAKESKSLIEDSVRKVEGGTALVNRSGATLDEIVIAVKRVTDIVAEIAAASREQAAGIVEVNRAMTLIDQTTEASAAQTEELSATAGNLSQQANVLHGLVSRFKLEPATPR